MFAAALFLGLCGLVLAAEPGDGSSQLGRVPVLGWSSWNAYGCDVDEEKILSAAKYIVSLGLKEAGYQFINIDDCWSVKSGRDPDTHRLVPDSSKFPHGIIGTATTIHDDGLLIGIYSSAGTETCAGYPASIGYETIDAQTWNEWGVDYLKYDNCNVPTNWTDSCASCDRDYPSGSNGTCTGSSDGLTLCASDYDYSMSNTTKRYQVMADALNTLNRTIVYSLCEWGTADVWTWANNTAASWRTTNDINATWPRILSILNQQSFIMDYTNFWGHGDADILEIGNGNLTMEEQRTHFAFWAAMKSPLLISTDLSNLSSPLVDLLKNPYLLKFNQDYGFGAPAQPYKWGTNDMWTFNASYPAEYWSGASSNGTLVLIFNPEDSAVQKTASWSEIPGLNKTAKYNVVDAWADKSMGCTSDGITTTVNAHDTNVFIITDGC